MSDDDENKKYKPTEDISEFSNKLLPDLLKNEKGELFIFDDDKEDDEVIDSDFKEVRNNIRTIIKNGENVLENLTKLAIASDSPRAYEVVSTLINTLLASNKELMDLHQKKQKVKGSKTESEKPKGNYTQNNNSIFVGSTAELAEFLNKNNDDNKG